MFATLALIAGLLALCSTAGGAAAAFFSALTLFCVTFSATIMTYVDYILFSSSVLSLTPSDFQCMFRIGSTYVQACRKKGTCWCEGMYILPFLPSSTWPILEEICFLSPLQNCF